MTPADRYTAQEVADILGIEVETLYGGRWRGASGCPVFKQGKYLFAFKKEFDKWYMGRLQYA